MRQPYTGPRTAPVRGGHGLKRSNSLVCLTGPASEPLLPAHHPSLAYRPSRRSSQASPTSDEAAEWDDHLAPPMTLGGARHE